MKLDEPMRVGKSAQLGPRRTSELPMLARGPALPPLPERGEAAVPESAPDTLPVDEDDPFRRGLERLRSAVEGSERAKGELRRLLQEKAAALACTPLVILYSGALAARRVAFVFRVAGLKPR